MATRSCALMALVGLSCGPAVETPGLDSGEDGSTTSPTPNGPTTQDNPDPRPPDPPTASDSGDEGPHEGDLPWPVGCGNGMVEDDEQCDDGVNGAVDSCNDLCEVSGTIVFDGTLDGHTAAAVQTPIGGGLAIATTFEPFADPWESSIMWVNRDGQATPRHSVEGVAIQWGNPLFVNESSEFALLESLGPLRVYDSLIHEQWSVHIEDCAPAQSMMILDWGPQVGLTRDGVAFALINLREQPSPSVACIYANGALLTQSRPALDRVAGSTVVPGEEAIVYAAFNDQATSSLFRMSTDGQSSLVADGVEGTPERLWPRPDGGFGLSDWSLGGPSTLSVVSPGGEQTVLYETEFQAIAEPVPAGGFAVLEQDYERDAAWLVRLDDSGQEVWRTPDLLSGVFGSFGVTLTDMAIQGSTALLVAGEEHGGGGDERDARFVAVTL